MAYADDLLLFSPTLNGLQEMTAEDYENTHNLTFITDPILKKCKTKCLAFLKKERNLKNIKLKGRDLPWVDAAKHLGRRIGPTNHGVALDLVEKRALYINRVNELNQEFHYAHPLTKVKINNNFNTHFYGSQLKLRSTTTLIPISMVRNCGICLVLKLLDWKKHGIHRKE